MGCATALPPLDALDHVHCMPLWAAGSDSAHAVALSISNPVLEPLRVHQLGWITPELWLLLSGRYQLKVATATDHSKLRSESRRMHVL